MPGCRESSSVQSVLGIVCLVLAIAGIGATALQTSVAERARAALPTLDGDVQTSVQAMRPPSTTRGMDAWLRPATQAAEP